MENYKCTYCKNDGFLRKDVLIHERKILKDGSEKIIYHCLECNRERAMNYRKTRVGKENIYKAVYKSIKKHSEKQKARYLMNRKIRTGEIIKPNECSECRKNPIHPDRIEGHHEDYSKPLEVIWLCKSCHRVADRLLRKKVI